MSPDKGTCHTALSLCQEQSLTNVLPAMHSGEVPLQCMAQSNEVHIRLQHMLEALSRDSDFDDPSPKQETDCILNCFTYKDFPVLH